MNPFAIHVETMQHIVIPHSMVMCGDACEYCGASGGKSTRFFWLFGIFHCSQHDERALQDTRWYFARRNLMPYANFYNGDCVVRKLIEDLRENPFAVVRSSGVVDDGWVLNFKDLDAERSTFTYLPNKGEWVMGVTKHDMHGNPSMFKNASLLEAAAHMEPERAQMVHDAIIVLDDLCKEYKNIHI